MEDYSIFEDLVADEDLMPKNIDDNATDTDPNNVDDLPWQDSDPDNADPAKSQSDKSTGSDPYTKLFDDTDDDLIKKILESKGLNPDAIQVLDEDESTKEVKFNELTPEEKLSLLIDEDKEVTDDNRLELDDDETSTINFLRENKITLNELVKQIKEKAASEYNKEPIQPTFRIDEFTDDELFIIDLKHRYGDDLTEDEMVNELEKAKENETLFNKRVGKLRTDYQLAETEQLKAEALAEEKKYNDERNAYIETINGVADKNTTLHNIVDLEDKDKKEIINFIFNPDPNNQTGLQKALSNPETLYKVAWYIKYGDKTFTGLQNQYQEELKNITTSTASTKPAVKAIMKPKSQHTTSTRPKTIEDLYQF